MHSILRPLRSRHRDHHRIIRRTLVDLSTINWVRDRGLDHAVEKEKNLKPLLNLKDLIKSEPSKSLPLSIINNNRDSLRIPIRPIEFIRRYPAVFEEYLPAGIPIHPHIKLTAEALTLDAEEQLAYNSESHLLESADRLLKLLMLANWNKIPLSVIDLLKWDLGLPHNYTETLIPNFPDCFQLNSDSLELVCWNNSLSVSVIENKEKKVNSSFEKGMPVSFPMQFSRGFEMDQKFKRWVDQWQKLPYISPYENALHLSTKSDEGDKWVVSVLHELLSLLYSKKSERENLFSFGECLGLRSRFKRALLHHPGIFYVSRKLGSPVVVLRDGYKRDLLIEKHPLMGIRYKYVHLMNTVKEDKKQKVGLVDSKKHRKPITDSNVEGDEKVDGDDEESNGVTGSEIEDEEEYDYENEDEDEDENQTMSRMNARRYKGRTRGDPRFKGKRELKVSVENGRDGLKRRRMRNYDAEDEAQGDGLKRRRMRNYDAEDEARRFSHTNAQEAKRDVKISSEFGRDGSNRRRTRRNENKDEGPAFSQMDSLADRGRTKERQRFGAKLDLRSSVGRGFDGSNRRSRDYEAEDEDRTFSRTNSQRGSGWTRFNSSSRVKRDSRTSAERGLDKSNRRTKRNYDDEDDLGRFSHTNSQGNRGKTREIPIFEVKKNLKTSVENGFRDLERKGLNGKRNDGGDQMRA